jgi:cupin 2 domain-containing protein
VLEPGDWLEIPPRVRHRVEWTSTVEPTIWLAVFHG